MKLEFFQMIFFSTTSPVIRSMASFSEINNRLEITSGPSSRMALGLAISISSLIQSRLSFAYSWKRDLLTSISFPSRRYFFL